MRMQNQMQLEAVQMRIQQLEMMNMLANGGGGNMGMIPTGPRQQWTNPFPNQQPPGNDSPYQRLPLNNRRRPQKRERPQDFVEVGGEGSEAKMMRTYWE